MSSNLSTGPQSRLLSLAAGTVLDVSPPEAIAAAARAGWPAAGVWYDPATWTPTVTAEVQQGLAATGLIALDIEPVIFGRGDHHGAQIIDVAAQIGARFVLVASGLASRSEVVDELGTIAALAAQTAPGVTLVLEFLPIFSIDSLDAAASIVTELDTTNVGVLVDTLHLARSGGTPADLAAYPPALFPYLQLADAALVPVDESRGGLRDEALHGRLLPGDGELPLAETLRTIRDVAVSVELRSKQLLERYPDPAERARAVLDSTTAVIASAHA